MRNTNRLEAARMSLTAAVTRSHAADTEHDPEGRATQEHALAADLRLRRGGREDLGDRVAQVLDDDVTTAAARREFREVAQQIDAELSPAVSTDSFRPASGGGVER